MNDILKGRVQALANVEPGTRLTRIAQGRIYRLLEASECLLIDSYNHSVSGSLPAIAPCDGTGGYLELGPALYWLNNPPENEIGEIISAIVAFLNVIEAQPLPASRLTRADYARIKEQATRGPGIVAPDGTIYGESQYEQLDDRWLLAFFYFLYYERYPDKRHPFGASPKTFPFNGDSLTIAIVGDWGTGRYGPDGGPAIDVLAGMQQLRPAPDVIVHLGDVYYAGTEGFDHVLSEEWGNFVELWPATWGTGTGKSFTLNSNHEMYDGANGYFGVALRDGAPFAHQKQTSYFALTYRDWTILGLDSAYCASPLEMFMVGSIGGKNGEQYGWIRNNFHQLAGRNVIVLTHHNPVDYTGRTLIDPLWSTVCEAVGGAGPAYWYWGHIHNAIVYASNPAIDQGVGTKIRCVGHGAIPFGDAWGLQGVGGIDYYAHTPIPNSIRMRNGFATLTLRRSGSITERFYETTGTPGQPTIAWSK